MTQDHVREQKLDALLKDAALTYRVPPEPPLDAIWAGIEAEAFPAVVATPVRRLRWILPAAVAASMVIGVLAGRLSVRGPDTQSVARATLARGSASVLTAAAPYQRETEEFLGNTAVLLAALPRSGGASATPAVLPEQAAHLLTTTRLLLDSPVATDARMRDLLQDLELVLVQVARLQPRRQNAELTMISRTLEARDLVPRIRTAVTALNSSDY